MHNDNCFRHDFLACGPLQVELLDSHILGEEEYMLASMGTSVLGTPEPAHIPGSKAMLPRHF